MADPSVLNGATIAFDLDGTLVDTAPDLVNTLNLLLGQEGVPALPMADASRLIGHGARRLIERGFEVQGQTVTPERMDALFARFLDHYQDHSTDFSRPFPGVVDSLTALKAAGARLSVCTNKQTGLSIPILEQLDLARFFDSVIGADRAPAKKPDKRHLIAAVETAGGRIDRAVMVGDASPDAGAARAAGAGLVLVSFGYTEIPVAELGADIVIDHYDELFDACVSLLTACGPEATGL